MFLSRNKKNNVYPCKPKFYYIKVGFKGIKIIYACFPDFLFYFVFFIGVLLYNVFFDRGGIRLVHSGRFIFAKRILKQTVL